MEVQRDFVFFMPQMTNTYTATDYSVGHLISINPTYDSSA